MKNFADVSREEQLEFIDSFDHVLVDLDGVLRHFDGSPVEGTSPCLDNLRKIGKSFAVVTNNATIAPEELLKELQANFNLELDEIFTPYVAVVNYLKKIKFERKIFLISTDKYRENLKLEGFNVADEIPKKNIQTIATLMESIDDDAEIGAVIFDVDFNLPMLKVQRASLYLQRPDCLLIIGPTDSKYSPKNGKCAITHKPLVTALTNISKNEPIVLSKPSKDFGDMIKEKLKIDPKRVLFIGDSIEVDMGFAAVNNYKKLLVLTGQALREDIIDWKYPENYKPDYYIEGLKEFNVILKKIKSI